MLKILGILIFGFGTSYSAFGQTTYECLNTRDGNVAVSDGIIRCDLQIQINDLEGMGIIDSIFDKIEFRQDINLDFFSLLASIEDDRIRLDSQAAIATGFARGGRTMTASITYSPSLLFSGLDICEMQITSGELNISRLESDQLPPFVENSIKRVANANSDIQNILVDVTSAFVPVIQEAIFCP